MKSLRLAAVALFLTVPAVAFAGTEKTTSEPQGRFMTSGWKQCVMTCNDGYHAYPSCNAPTANCCALADISAAGCGLHWGLANGVCTEPGGEPEYCWE
jgi:hypothetical protein